MPYFVIVSWVVVAAAQSIAALSRIASAFLPELPSLEWEAWVLSESEEPLMDFARLELVTSAGPFSRRFTKLAPLVLSRPASFYSSVAVRGGTDQTG